MPRRLGTFRRYMKEVEREENRRTWLGEVWQPLALAAVALAAWGVGRGFMRPEEEPERVDYSAFFHGKVTYLGDHRVRLFYDFEPVDDPLTKYPQLQDWSYSDGVVKDMGWLKGRAALNVPFEDEVVLSFKFMIRRGDGGIMPAVGVRGKKGERTFVGVLLERSGMVTVYKYLSGMPHTVRSFKGLFRLELNREYRLRLEAKQVTVKDFRREAGGKEERLHPELDPHSELFGEVAAFPSVRAGGGGSVPDAPVPGVRLKVFLDGFEVVGCVVPMYELKGWVALLAWDCVPLFDDVEVEGKLYPLWVLKEMEIRRILEGGGKR